MPDVANRPTISMIFGTELVSHAILQDRPRLPHRPVSSLSGICPKLSMDDAYEVVSRCKKDVLCARASVTFYFFY